MVRQFLSFFASASSGPGKPDGPHLIRFVQPQQPLFQKRPGAGSVVLGQGQERLSIGRGRNDAEPLTVLGPDTKQIEGPLPLGVIQPPF